MSQGLTNTKRRINSISSTRKITKAMELVATVKLKRWKDNMGNALSYLNSMEEIIFSCASGTNDDNDIKEFVTYPKANANLYVVVTSSLGLCGGYNYNLLKFLNERLEKNDKVLMLGTKGFSYLHGDFDIDDSELSFLDKFNYSKVSNLLNKIKEYYFSGNFNKVYLISTTYKNSLTFIPTQIQILPLENLSKKESLEEVLFEPNKEEVLSLIVPKYLETLLYGRLTEAMVCEQAARRNAMDSANDNADELLNKLKLEFNKARQASITQEITEVVAGSLNK